MTLLDQITADVTSVFLAPGGLAQDAQFVCAGLESGTPLRALFGDNLTAAALVVMGQEQRRTARVLCALADVRAATLAQTGAARLPERGDALSVAGTGAWAGTWRVTTASPDEGGGVLIDCALAEMDQVAGEGVLEQPR